MAENTFVPPKPRVFHSIPWNSDKNIGKSYNETMSLVRTNDWVCFIDGDAVHTTHFFGKYIELVIEKNPQYSIFTCVTNRIGCPHQIAPGIDQKNDNQTYHREFGKKMWETYNTEVTDITNKQLFSGVIILIKKSVWERLGGFKEDKMLAIDNDIHIKAFHAKLKVGLMKGIYVQHWYRGGNQNNKSHLL
jgi:GT2 family glycosyltransferase